MNFQKRFDFPQIRYELASGYFPLDEKHTLHSSQLNVAQTYKQISTQMVLVNIYSVYIREGERDERAHT